MVSRSCYDQSDVVIKGKRGMVGYAIGRCCSVVPARRRERGEGKKQGNDRLVVLYFKTVRSKGETKRRRPDILAVYLQHYKGDITG